MKIALFFGHYQRYETFSEHGFQVSGVGPALAFSLLTPDTFFHAIPQQLGCHSHLSKLNDDICIYGHLTNQR